MTFSDEQRENIERTIADLTAERDRIDEAVRVLSRLIGGEPEPAAGNAQPPAAAKKPAPGRKSAPVVASSAAANDRRLRIAKFLADGPRTLAEVRARLDIPEGSIGYLMIQHPWFEKAGEKLRDPYRLTDAGRKALDGAGSSTT